MPADTTRRLISETQEALNVPEEVDPPDRPDRPTAPRPEVFPLEPTEGGWAPHDRWSGREPGTFASPGADSRRVDDEEPFVPIEDLPPDGLLLDDPKRSQPGTATASFDAAACYVPFHFSTRRWGIYVWKSGLLGLVRDLTRKPHLLASEAWIVGFAWQALFLHELFHHWVEVAVARAQAPAVLGAWPTLSPTFRALYPLYFYDDPASHLEEALANSLVAKQIDRAYDRSFRSAQAFAQAKRQLLQVMSAQPRAYCEYDRFLTRTRHARGKAHLIDRAFLQPRRTVILKISPNRVDYPLRPTSQEILPADLWFTSLRVSGDATCPIYFIDDVPTLPIIFGKPFPKRNGLEVFVYPNDHKPPHIHAFDLKTRKERRFTWDDLQPLESDRTVPSPRDVKKYCDEFHGKIDKKVKSISWR